MSRKPHSLSCRRRPRPIRVAVAATLLVPLPLRAAQPVTWIASAGGTFSDVANWSPSAPSAADTPTFNLAASYPVYFTSSPTTASLDVLAGSVTFSAPAAAQSYTLTGALTLHGGSLSLAGPAASPLALSAASVALSNASTLAISNGSDLSTAGALSVGDGSNATLTLAGAGTSLLASSATPATLAYNGATASFALSSSATVTLAGGLNVAAGAASSSASISLDTAATLTLGPTALATSTLTSTRATLTLAGPLDTSLTMAPGAPLTIGADSRSTATVTLTGGQLTTSDAPLTVNRTGTINATGGYVNLNGPLVLNGGTVSGLLSLPLNANASPLTLTNGGKLLLSNSYSFTLPPSTNLSSYGTLTLPSSTQLTLAAGAVTASGTSSISAGTLLLGPNGAPAPSRLTLTFNNSDLAATSTAAGALSTLRNVSLSFAGNATNGDAATLSVAHPLTIIDSSVSFAGLAAAWGGPAVNLYRSSLSFSNNAYLTGGTITVGSSSDSAPASLTLDTGIPNSGKGSGSVVQSLVINKTGSVTLQGGELDINRQLLLDGGTLSLQSGTLSHTVAASTSFTVQNAAKLLLGPSFTIFELNTAVIKSGSSVSAAGDLNSPIGSFTLDGTNTSLSVAGNATLGSSSSSYAYQITVRNGASISVAGSLSLYNTLGLTASSSVTAASTLNNATLSLYNSSASLGTVTRSIYGGSLSLSGTSSLTLRSMTQYELYASGGTVTLTPSPTPVPSLLNTLSLYSPAKLDLGNSPLLIDYFAGSSPIDRVRSYLAAKSLATSQPNHTLAYAEASLLTPAQQQRFTTTTAPDDTTLLIAPALPGDINLDGVLNPDDYALLDRSFARGTMNAHWTDGDFNYDGQVTSADYFLIDTVYGQAQGFSPGFLSVRESQFGEAYVSELLATVPEPSLLACLFAGSPLLTRRARGGSSRGARR